MKKNLKNNMAQKGGLMIEALAMLGLIAVVTPTMYKKSAERTLEVEDINTADTVRSYMGATEAYMAANYRNLIKEMTENDDGTKKEDPDTIKTVSWDDIKSYMPYGFQNEKSLHHYKAPQIAIWRDGTNLTAYALFPAKGAGDNGLGQERTSRIASLIGANGGYTKSDKTAHGIGGVWNLSADDVKNAFGSGTINELSLVTASSNVVNSTSGAGAVENTKYLQRTAENTDEKWRNAMRTDLYMGGGDAGSDPDDDNTDNHSIVNINSLIVGAEKDKTGAKNGLYIAGTETWTDANNVEHTRTNENINAYIAGTLTALSDKFIVGKDTNNKGYVYFGDTNASKNDSGGNAQYPFRISESGKVTTTGDLDLANTDQAKATNISAQIGSFAQTTGIKVNGAAPTNPNLFFGSVSKGDNPSASLSLLSDEMFKMTTDNVELASGVDNVGGTHVLIEANGYRGVDNEKNKDNNGNLLNAKRLLPTYSKDQTFPVVIGSNTMVKGVLSAGQLDVDNIRSASLQTGSANIDDDYKWLTVNQSGITFQDINTMDEVVGTDGKKTGEKIPVGVQGHIGSSTLEFKTGTGTSDASISMQRNVSTDTNGNKSYSGDVAVKGHKISAVNENMGLQISDRDLTIGSKGSGNTVNVDGSARYRVVVGKGGDVDMIGSNLKIMDSSANNILTVKGNTNTETTDTFGTAYNDFNNSTNANDPSYNVIAHGNVLFGSKNSNPATGTNAYDDDSRAHYMAIGPNDEKAGVNIAEGSANTTKNSTQRVMFVDLSAKNTTADAYVNPVGYSLTSDASSPSLDNRTMEAGTVYVRKGLVDIVADKNAAKSTTGNSDKGANDGSGIIRASRFVANNINSSGAVEKVPGFFTDTAINDYYGTNTVRYDSYMVNPAYTSVMKDIKLVTRGGARLSDILPDFITKGIYLASNTFNDTMSKMSFTLKDGTFTIDGGPDEGATTGSGDTSISNNWASPYSGLVPAPQCPPGYGRVITINPYRFEMAQAGQLALSADAGNNNNSGYYVNTTEMSGKLERASYSNTSKEELENELLRVMPGYYDLKVEWNSGNISTASLGTGFTTSDGKTVSGSGPVTISGATGLTAHTDIPQYDTNQSTSGSADDTGSSTTSKESTYVLSATEKGMRPLVFQQSTWLHTEAVPVADKTTTYVGADVSGKYVRGWAVLQGFLYHHSEYSNFACASGDCKELSPIEKTDEHAVLWNLFPVAKNSLGSYVTTYCYFDRANMYGNYKDTTPIEQLDVLSEVPSSYKKGDISSTRDDKADRNSSRDTYYKNLNDPTMKYNEVW